MDNINLKINDCEENEGILTKFIKNKDFKDLYLCQKAIDDLEGSKQQTLEWIKSVFNPKKLTDMIKWSVPQRFQISVETNKVLYSKNKDIVLEFSKEEKVNSNKRVKIGDNISQIWLKDEGPFCYYSKIDLKNNITWKLKKDDKIVKILPDSTACTLNQIVIISNNLNPNNLEFELTIIKRSDEIKKYIDYVKSTIIELTNRIEI